MFAVTSAGERWTARRSHKVVGLGDGRLLLIGGFARGSASGSSSEVWVGDASGGAFRWSLADASPFGPRDGHAAVRLGGAVLVLGGASTGDRLTTHDVWRSGDGGATFDIATETPGWCGRTHHEAVAHGARVVVLGGFGEFGYCNDCWASEDGATWERLTASAAWSPRAMHAAASFRGGLYVLGGYEGRGVCNDVWASVDGAVWARVSQSSPWTPRRGHSVVALGDDCLCLFGGESGSESLGDCWTSCDGAAWSLVAFDLPRRHAHAAACHSGGLLIFGGATTARSSGGDASTTEVVADCFGIAVPAAETPAPPGASASLPLSVSMRAVIGAVAELHQLRAALKEVQRGNAQLVALVRRATRGSSVVAALDAKVAFDEPAPSPVPLSRKNSSSGSLARIAASPELELKDRLSYNLERAANRLTKAFAKFPETFYGAPEAAGPASSPQRAAPRPSLADSLKFSLSGYDRAASIRAPDPSARSSSDRSGNLERAESCSSFFDALEDADSSGRGSRGAQREQTIDLADFCDDDGGEFADPAAALRAAHERALAVDDGLSGDWASAVHPCYDSIRRIAVLGLDRQRLEAQVERRKAAVAKARVSARVAERRLALLESAALSLSEAAEGARERLRASLAVESAPRGAFEAGGSMDRSSRSFDSLRAAVAESMAADTPASPASAPRHPPAASIDGDLGDDGFEAVAEELASHCARPQRADSARRHADAALRRLGEALRARAAAAAALCAGALSTGEATKPVDTEDLYDSVLVDVAAAARAASSAATWDADGDLARAKLDAHGAVGAELAAIPRELDEALRLKGKLLRSGEARCRATRNSAKFLARVAWTLCKRAKRWDAWYEAAALPRRGPALVAAADAAVDRVLSLEDRKTDALGALDKSARRARRLNAPMGVHRSSTFPPRDEVLPAKPDLGPRRPSFSLVTGATVAEPEVASKPLFPDVAALFSPPRDDARLSSKKPPRIALPRPTSIAENRSEPSSPSSAGPAEEETVDGLRRAVDALDAELAGAVRVRRRAVAAAARCCYTEQPELAWTSRVIVDSIGKLKLLGEFGGAFDGGDAFDELDGSARGAPKVFGGDWLRAPSRDLAEYEPAPGCPERGGGGHLVRLDASTGDEVLLKAYALDEGDDERRWCSHEAELDALLALPRHDALAAPRALVSARWAPLRLRGAFDDADPVVGAPMIYLEFLRPRFSLAAWARASPRAPWHVQAVARQVLTGLFVLHSRNVVHGHVSPSTVVVLDGDRAQLATRHLLEALREWGGDADEAADLADFAAPEVERREVAGSCEADMFAFGAVLAWLNRATKAEGHAVPRTGDDDLGRLVEALTDLDASKRPSAADAAVHPYFQNSYMDRYIAGGDIVGPNAKLEAVRDLLSSVRSESRAERAVIEVRRGDALVDDVLAFFGREAVNERRFQEGKKVQGTRRPLKVTFAGEAGVDEGGLTAEMFALFFEAALKAEAGLFEDAGGEVVLPARMPESPTPKEKHAKVERLEAFGRALVTACYEGCGAPSRLGPSLFKYLAHGARHAAAGDGRALRDLQKFDPVLGSSLEYMLSHAPPLGGDWGLDFSDVDASAQSRPVTEANKHSFVVLKVRHALVGCRTEPLDAIRRGFVAALHELSPEASPFLKLFSSTDWRVLLCAADEDLTPSKVLAKFKYVGFAKASLVPDALNRAIAKFDKDSLRRFLVFATGSPSLPPESRDFEMQVRAMPRSNSLPVAHTCFFHVDIPEYASEEEFITKLMTAIHECGSFDRV